MLGSIRTYGGEQSITQTKRKSGLLTLDLPMERLECSRGVFPRGLAQGVDDERDDYHHYASDDEHGIPHRLAAHGNLSGRDKAEDEGKQ